MAASTGLLLVAGGIGAGNEFLHGHGDAAVKIGVAMLGTAVVFAAIEQIPGGGREFAVGLAALAVIGVVIGGFTPGVPSPAVQLLQFTGYATKGK